ncbi:hypothetical protein H7347_06840 [Corynebacterium sp. zg-331]|uniref:phage tail tube protein n=1 Tax=unclassified Corynebacterium TaxID=2624378 RepID=UPI00128BFB2C|nr:MULTISPECIES: hypothetical protein [unclassified Corynebacterium]MBC3186288.1 hypothetical protein [Corynebacterium sp. zg-331]MPV52777.1 hypothetical protein [Corynebacterium sp. zg331]
MADMRNRRNVLVGAPDVTASGGILIGPVATKSEHFPSSATEELSTELKMVPAGYISEDGVSKTVDRSTEKIKDWNGDTILITQSDHSVTLTLTFMEAANADVLKIIAGEDNVTVEEGDTIKVIDNADELPHRSIAFEIKGGRGSKIRVFAPDVQCTSVGDVSYVRADVIKYEATLECFDVDNKKLISLIKRADEKATTAGVGRSEGLSEG